MRIRLVDPRSRRDVKQFVRLPFALYRRCPQWVPPLMADVARALDPERHVFYRRSQAAFFLAESEGSVVGRLAVLDNRPYNDYHGSDVAHFCLFEAVDDRAVAEGLFAAAERWARQRGLTRLVGSKGMLRADGLGVLVEGFEHRPAVGIPYNYAYYGPLLESIGFVQEIDYLSAYLSASYHLPQRVHQLAERVKTRRGLAVKTFTSKDELRGWVPAIQRVNNEAFTQVWGYYPMDQAEAQAVADNLLAIADPRLIKLVLKGDEVVGFLFTFHDISEGLQRARGRLWPLGWLHLLRAFKRTDRANLNGMGLLPGHQGVGANAILYTELEKSFRQFGFRHAEFVQISKENSKSLGEAMFTQPQWIKRHRIYRRAITGLGVAAASGAG
jgi:GNAT superfamily N-acetyltransferase